MKKGSLLSKHAKSFYWAGFFLPKKTLAKCSYLYDFCRTLDDIADQKNKLTFKKKQFKILKLNFLKKNKSIPIIRNIWKLLKEENISKKIILDLFDGVETDLKESVKIVKKDSLFLYSYRVAGTVGLMMAKILKVKRKDSLMGAIDLGVAMQLTNIARDVLEDKENNRSYILHNFLSIKKTIKTADIFYSSSFASIQDIPLSFRFSIIVARRVYRQIGYEILNKNDINNYNLAGKIYVSKTKKCIQTLLSIVDFIHLFFVGPRKNKNKKLYSIIKKKINLDERI